MNLFSKYNMKLLIMTWDIKSKLLHEILQNERRVFTNYCSLNQLINLPKSSINFLCYFPLVVSSKVCNRLLLHQKSDLHKLMHF